MTSARAHNTNRPAVVRPGKDGYILVGGGIINHYRHWNAKAGFGEAYPKGNSWSCKVGFGNGDFTCQALSYKLPPGTRCINRKASSNNAGVVHAALPLGYTMVSGGVQNLYRRWNRLSAFEESLPSGNRWRCDTGFGPGRLNCFVRGCKFPHGGKCVTTSTTSHHAGWVWAQCPAGYRVFGCGMNNRLRSFNPRSGFEEIRPIGNKCMGDMGFGPGRVTVYARCCKVTGPPPKVPPKPPSPPPEKAAAGSVSCMANIKWEKKRNFRCISRGLGTSRVSKPSDCAFKCSKNSSCKAFAFKGNMCSLRGGRNIQQTSTPNVTCRGVKARTDYYSSLPGSCKSSVAKLLSAHRRRAGVAAERRRRTVHKRRGGRL